MIKAINLVSRYTAVALKWRDIAQNLNIKIPPTFGERSTDSYEIVVQSTVGNDDHTTEEKSFTLVRVIDIPISAQEKCLHILAEWYRMYPNGIVVSSLKKVLEDCRLNYIAGKKSQRGVVLYLGQSFTFELLDNF